jgi:hypothetical protein
MQAPGSVALLGLPAIHQVHESRRTIQGSSPLG